MKEEAHAFCRAGSIVVSDVSLGVVVGALTVGLIAVVSAGSASAQTPSCAPDTNIITTYGPVAGSPRMASTNGSAFSTPPRQLGDGLTVSREIGPAREHPRELLRCRRDR